MFRDFKINALDTFSPSSVARSGSDFLFVQVIVNNSNSIKLLVFTVYTENLLVRYYYFSESKSINE